MTDIFGLGSAALACLTAALYAYIGRVVSERPAEGNAQTAIRAFALWWFALAVSTFIGGARTFLVVMGVHDLVFHEALGFIAILPLVMSLWGLMSYLLFIYTGSLKPAWTLALVYSVIYAYFVYLFVWLNPVDVRIGAGASAVLVNTNTLDSAAVAFVVAVLVLPIVIGAIAYGSLYWKTQEPIQRFRIATISLGILAWFLSPAFGSAAALQNAAWWIIFTRIVAIAIPLTILVALRPPPWLLRRLGAAQSA
ncbi:MAG TPA: hypothetical protein VM889_03810 [Candidatus Thermoplasmatota archaeon]|nr:hypothetical protein [Candidatus Thermoplasmatota archaeon]